MNLQDLQTVLSAVPLLVMHGDQVFLARRDAVFERQGGYGPVGPVTVLDVQRAYDLYWAAVKDGPEPLSQRDVATLSGLDYFTCRHWRKSGLIRASIQDVKHRPAEFAKYDGFVCGVLAALRRSGVEFEALRKVGAFFYSKQISRALKKARERELVTA